jgi:acetyl esterase/lipase
MDVKVEKDLVFVAQDGSDLALDIYRPSHDDAPVALYVHGGGWRSGDKADDGARRLVPLSACGVTVVAVSYRLVPRAQFPAQLHDLKTARLGLPPSGWAFGGPPQERIWARCSP